MTWKIKAGYQKRLSLERGAVRKDHGGKIRVALAYPNTYYVGMSNLGFLTMYRMLNQRHDIVAERVFLPDSEEFELYRTSGAELLTLESQRPVSAFDVVAFSVPFENDFSNILTLLDLARIPSPSSARSPSHPPVLAGGVATFLNPEPIAAFIDLFLLGEAEALIDDMVDFLRQWQRAPEQKAELLRENAQRPGFYVPALYQVAYDEKNL